jgi:DNA-binding NarL/FixJ family response regulator
MNEDPDLAAEAFRAGAARMLLKRSAGSELLDAIREVMKHHCIRRRSSATA